MAGAPAPMNAARVRLTIARVAPTAAAPIAAVPTLAKIAPRYAPTAITPPRLLAPTVNTVATRYTRTLSSGLLAIAETPPSTKRTVASFGIVANASTMATRNARALDPAQSLSMFPPHLYWPHGLCRRTDENLYLPNCQVWEGRD